MTATANHLCGRCLRTWRLTAEELYEIFAAQYEPVYERGEDREMFWRDVLDGTHGSYFPPFTPEVRI